MLTVSIDYRDKMIGHPGDTFSSVKQERWLQDPLIQEALLTIDKATVVEGFCIRDRWGHTVPPEYMSHGFKTLTMMKFYKEYPVYGTRCGDNCIPFIERIAAEQNIHIVLHHCMHFSVGFKFYVTDVSRIVTSFEDWVDVFYAVADTMV